MFPNARCARSGSPAPRDCETMIAAPDPIMSPNAVMSITSGHVTAAAARPSFPIARPMKIVSTIL